MLGGQQHFGVVVGIHGSAPSDAAVRWAACEAAMRKLRLTLVHALATPALPWPAAPMPTELRQRQEVGARVIIDDAVKVAEDTITDGGPAEIEANCSFPCPCRRWSICLKTHTWWWSALAGWVRFAACCWDRSAPGWSIVPLSRRRYPQCGVPAATGRPQFSATGQRWITASELATAIAFEEHPSGRELVALHAWRDADMAHIPSMEEGSLIGGWKPWPSGWPAGGNATQTSASPASWNTTGQPLTFSSTPSLPSLSSSAVTAVAGSPERCSGRSAPQWHTQPAHR